MPTRKNVTITALQAPAKEAARWLALGAIAGPVLFEFAWLLLGLARPGYSLVITPISDLGLGQGALLMNAAFVLQGVLWLVGLIGVFQSLRGEMGAASRWTCAALLALAPLGSVVDGIFTLATPFGHLVGFLLAFALAPLLGFTDAGLLLRRIPRWRRFGNWLLLGGPLTLALLVLFFVTFSPSAVQAGTGVAGLTERIAVIELHAWYVALGWLAFRRS